MHFVLCALFVKKSKMKSEKSTGVVYSILYVDFIVNSWKTFRNAISFFVQVKHNL